MAERDYDAVIVGAGAGGASVAYGLARKGVNVLLLEAGPRFDPSQDFSLDKPTWELTRFPRKAGSRGILQLCRYAAAG